MADWTPEDCERLVRLVEKGTSLARAAVIFRRRMKSVQIKARKLGKPFPDFKTEKRERQAMLRSDAADSDREQAMSKETPKDDPRQRKDRKSFKQTDEPWKGPPEKEQKPGGPPPDLERWHESNTH